MEKRSCNIDSPCCFTKQLIRLLDCVHVEAQICQNIHPTFMASNREHGHDIGRRADSLSQPYSILEVREFMFLPVRTIAAKRDGQPLSTNDIKSFIAGYTDGSIPDYQMSSLLMAILCNGMSADETAQLTAAMLASGDRLAFPKLDKPIVDKHSTGGVGDKVSLPLAPMLACCDVAVPMISGRGLGLTGGTLDKLESIPGFRVRISTSEIDRLVRTLGVAMAGQTENLVPADRKIYALRDVTATVPSIPLITASIMSKKLAEGLDALVLDVKFGRGAFMQEFARAKALAESMVNVGTSNKLKTIALLTDMNQPLGKMVGHVGEVLESLAVLEGNGPNDLVELTLALGAELLVAVKRAPTLAAARAMLEKTISSGSAREKFAQMCAAQGGQLNKLPKLAPANDVLAKKSGFVSSIDLESIGYAMLSIGAGRNVASDVIDHRVGFEYLVRVGDKVQKGQPLLRLFATKAKADKVLDVLTKSLDIVDQSVAALPLIVGRITHKGYEELGANNSSTTFRPDQELCDAAISASKQAYAPYSDFPVGAALRTTDHRIITGTNVENISFGLTQCAERTAVCTGVTSAKEKFRIAAIAVASRGGVSPCGACRQVLAEFADQPDIPVYMVDLTNQRQIAQTTLAQLLPNSFKSLS